MNTEQSLKQISCERFVGAVICPWAGPLICKRETTGGVLVVAYSQAAHGAFELSGGR